MIIYERNFRELSVSEKYDLHNSLNIKTFIYDKEADTVLKPKTFDCEFIVKLPKNISSFQSVIVEYIPSDKKLELSVSYSPYTSLNIELNENNYQQLNYYIEEEFVDTIFMVIQKWMKDNNVYISGEINLKGGVSSKTRSSKILMGQLVEFILESKFMKKEVNEDLVTKIFG